MPVELEKMAVTGYGFARRMRHGGIFAEALQTDIVPERFTFEKGETRGGGTAPPARSERENRAFPRNDRPYGLKCEAFQTENALERFTFEKGETRGGGTAPPGPK